MQFVKVDLLQPVMVYFVTIWKQSKFDKYWVSRCFMAKHWLIYSLIFTKLVCLLLFLFFVFLIFYILNSGFSQIVYSIWSTNHVKPRIIILGKYWKFFWVSLWLSQLLAMMSREVPTIALTIGMNISSKLCPFYRIESWILLI